MSHAGSLASGRGKPRWSVVIGLGREPWSVQLAIGIASIAGLSAWSAMVGVGPPLSVRMGLEVESSGSTPSPLFAEPVWVNPQELSSEML